MAGNPACAQYSPSHRNRASARSAIELVSAEGKVTTRGLVERVGISRPTAAVLKGLVGNGMLAWHGKTERGPISSTPYRRPFRPDFRVTFELPFDISATAATRARSTRWQRSSTSSGKTAAKMAAKYGKVTTKALADAVGISSKSASQTLRGLVERKVLVWHGRSTRDNTMICPLGLRSSSEQKG